MAPRKEWIYLGLSLSIMAAGGLGLWKVKASQKLGEPGVRLIQGEEGGWTVPFPDRIGEAVAKRVAPDEVEKSMLPADTILAKVAYHADELPPILASVVLMGSDRTSIHHPRFCLTGQGWVILKEETLELDIPGLSPSRLPVNRVQAQRTIETPEGEITLSGFYYYWFVCRDAFTASHRQRMWWMAQSLLQNGELQRWAYLSVLGIGLPGGEKALVSRVETILQGVAPAVMDVQSGGNPNP